jgi:hypothetical protein
MLPLRRNGRRGPSAPIEADATRRLRPMTDLQHAFRGSHACRSGVWRNDELLFQARFEDGFEHPPDGVVADALTMFNTTTLSSSSRNVHRARPFDRSEHARVISFASAAPLNTRGLAEAAECLSASTASNPSSTSCCRVRATVARLVLRAEVIRPSLRYPTRLRQAGRRST